MWYMFVYITWPIVHPQEAVDDGMEVAGGEVAEVDGQRGEQMTRLRGLVLPGLTFLLHSVLHSSQLYQEATRLADLVAAEQHALYKVGHLPLSDNSH